MNYPVGPAIDHLRPCVHCAVTLCTVQLCSVWCQLCCAVHFTQVGNTRFLQYVSPCLAGYPFGPMTKDTKCQQRKKSDTKEHFKGSFLAAISQLWSDSLGWHARPICKNSHNVQHQISRYFAYIYAFVLVVITFSKADAERLRLIKRELRLTSDYYKSD